MLSRLKESLTQQSGRLATWTVEVLLTTVAVVVAPAVWPPILETLGPKVLLPLFGLSLVANGFLCLALWRERQSRRMEIWAGAYWDTKGHPYCLACQTPLHPMDERDEWLLCLKCSTTTRLFDGPTQVKITEARTRMQKQS